MRTQRNKTHTTAVVLIPPEDLWPPIQAIRQQHDRHLRRWMPHITLLYPFRPRTEFEDLARQFAELGQQISPFAIRLAELHTFQHGREQYTLWFAPEPAAPIIRLQTSLWEVVSDCDDVRKHSGGFTPHLSVGQVRGKTHMERLKHELQTAWQPLTWRIQTISLIWRGQPPDDVFQIGKIVSLTGI